MRDEDGEPVAVTSRERKDAADASLAELKLAREKKEVLPEAEYRLAACALVANARARILGLPSRFAQRNPGAPAEQIALLDSLCREALTELETWDALEVPA
jgi:phage terminase Nu1 subunit (DNA packaging protein)